jgi:hypothetical protein
METLPDPDMERLCLRLEVEEGFISSMVSGDLMLVKNHFTSGNFPFFFSGFGRVLMNKDGFKVSALTVYRQPSYLKHLCKEIVYITKNVIDDLAGNRNSWRGDSVRAVVLIPDLMRPE